MIASIDTNKSAPSSGKHEPGDYEILDEQFATDDTRKIFIRKVFGLATGQLFLNLLFCITAMSSPTITNALTSHLGQTICIVCSIALLAVTCMTLCYEDLLRRHPLNLWFYGLFSCLTTYMIGYVSVVTDPTIVLHALIGTVIITTSLTLFAVQTKYDYTPCGAGLFVLLIIIIFVSIITTTANLHWLNILLLIAGLIIFMLYLIIDVQMIVGGSHIRYTFDETDYVLAALCLYLDIINIFLKLIQLMQEMRDAPQC